MTVPETKTETAEAPPAPAKPARSTPIVAWLVLLVIVVVVLVGASPFWAPSLGSALPWGRAGADSAALGALKTRFDAAQGEVKSLSERVTKLEARPIATLAPPTAVRDPAEIAALREQLATIPAQLDALKERVAKLSAGTADADALKEQVAKLSAGTTEADALKDQVTKLAAGASDADARIVKLEGEIAKAGERSAAERVLLLALANLRIAVAGSGPYAAEFAAAKALAPDRPELTQALAPLADGADKGIPSQAALAERFDRDTAPAILRAATQTQSDNWLDLIWARLARLVVIRRVGPNGAEPSDPTEAMVAKAANALRADDLAGAIKALEPLSGPAANAAAPWLAAAKERVAAEAALGALWQSESARIAATPAEAKP
jgi:hypothetical protein